MKATRSILATDSIEKKLGSVRPQLRQVAPLTHAICWGYAVINIGIGLGMFFLYETRVPLAIANILSYPQWGAIFFILGVYTVYALVSNNWAAAKRAQIIGLTVKAIWAIALIFRVFEAP